jgi:hypothetical protein
MSAPSTQEDSAFKDALLERLVGKWRITREFAKRVAENDAVVTWELNHHYLRIVMKDVAIPSMYEAHVYIAFEREASRYAIHWMDVTSGSMPELMGYGQKQGDSIVFEWREDEGVLRNTFTWHAADDTWTSSIEQTDRSGAWKTFCVDTYRRSD